MVNLLSRLERIFLSAKYGFTVPEYDGMMNAIKCQFLWQIVSSYKGVKGVILEIGSWQGCSTTWLGVAGQRLGFQKLIAVDLFTGTPSWGLKGRNTYDVFLKRMKRNHLDSFVQAVIGDSKDVIKSLSLPDGISILHVDGDHEYSAVKSDFNNYLPRLNKGGILIVDDFDSFHPDVMKATQELIDSRQYKIIKIIKEIKDQGYGSIALEKV